MDLGRSDCETMVSQRLCNWSACYHVGPSAWRTARRRHWAAPRCAVRCGRLSAAPNRAMGRGPKCRWRRTRRTPGAPPRVAGSTRSADCWTAEWRGPGQGLCGVQSRVHPQAGKLKETDCSAESGPSSRVVLQFKQAPGTFRKPCTQRQASSRVVASRAFQGSPPSLKNCSLL